MVGRRARGFCNYMFWRKREWNVFMRIFSRVKGPIFIPQSGILS